MLNIIPAGKMRQRVTLKAPASPETFDSFAQPIPNYTTLITCWGYLRGLTGREAIIAKQVKATATDALTTRYLGAIAINPTVQVFYKSRVFGIISVINVDERNIQYEYILQEIQATGSV